MEAMAVPAMEFGPLYLVHSKKEVVINPCAHAHGGLL